MGAEFRARAVLAAVGGCVVAFAGACGGHKEVNRVERPREEILSRQASGLGRSAAPGLLRSCITRASAPGLIELACDQHILVEFRRVEDESVSSEQGLDELMSLLEARFGTLSQERRQGSIDELPVQLSQFDQQEAGGVHGLAATIGNKEGHFWGLACYRKGSAMDSDFCGDAIATGARSGGLAYVEAEAMHDFADGKLVAAEGCQSIPGLGISCETGKLSWSADELEASSLRDEMVAKVERTAQAEGVPLTRSQRACTLLGKAAQCLWLSLVSQEDGEELNFVMVTGGGQKRLVVCTYPGPVHSSAPLPEPCGQAIGIE